jgi:hypothetical protein
MGEETPPCGLRCQWADGWRHPTHVAGTAAIVVVTTDVLLRGPSLSGLAV